MYNNLINKKFLLFAALFLSAPVMYAQYYFNDIIGTQETNRLMKDYRAANVKTITATGYDPQGVKAADFMELQEIKENGTVLKITSHTASNHTVYYNRFDEQGRLVSYTDSSATTQTASAYRYDASGKITQIETVTKDSEADFNQTEIHQWIYNSNGQPEKMWRILNAADSLEIRFVPDENGGPGEEKTFRKGVETGTVYYYYNDKKRMTDIVRYNTKLKRLMPDILFEYDDNDRIIQKITTTSSLNLRYLIWRYIFDNRGLKTKEALFNHNKQLTGKIEYRYTFQG